MQNEIESYLFNANNAYAKEGSDIIYFNFSSITSKWVIEKRNLIKEYLSNAILNETPELSSISFAVKYNNASLKIINELGVEKTSSILISFFLELLNKECSEGRLIQTELFYLLGNKLVNLYIFKHSNNYLNNPNEDSKLTLSKWKLLNKHLIDPFSDSPTIVGLAGNLAWLLTTASVDLIEFDTEMGDDRKQHHIIRLRESARSIMLKDNQIVYTTPPRLPMIVEPKPYKWNNNNIELGGYLNNDVFYTSDLFIDKTGYRDCTKLKKENNILDLINGVSCVPYKINKEVLEFIKVYGV